MPFSRGKTGFFSLLKKTQKAKQRKKTKTNKKKENKEGLGPSEVALWATSPDPLNPPKKTKQKNKKKTKTKK